MSIARRSGAFRWTPQHPDTFLPVVLACCALLVGVAAWAYYFNAGLVLSHYDAKAHLVVARRVIDNLTPGWQQVGAVWLPLPHLLLLFPVQIDLLYRTGLAGSLLSLTCLGVTAFAMASFVRRTTGSSPGAMAAVALLTLNPNLLYLFTTPMTEPLLFAVTSLLIWWLTGWLGGQTTRVPRLAGVLLIAAAWTRYEAWAVIAAAGLLSLAILLWQRAPSSDIARRALAYSVWPIGAALAFLVDSRITVGQWFVSDGFFVPDPTYAGKMGATLQAIAEGTVDLSGSVVVLVATAGAAATVIVGLRHRVRSGAWIGLALLGSLALPLTAFFDGHPFRIRYMTPLVAAAALWAGMAVGALPRRFQWMAAGGLVLAALAQAPPLSGTAPMVIEAQLDRPAGAAREVVSECLSSNYRGEKVLASMGALAHYMQELSWYGFALRDFVHEGNGIIWEVALETGPAPVTGWMLVEEVAEGGDVLAQRIRRDPAFAAGMTRVCASGGVALYRRDAR
ncbi:MAG: hypothetical protein ABL986_11155 [Vicinamibacterales bacterium]